MPKLADQKTRITNFNDTKFKHTTIDRFVFNIQELLRLNSHINTVVIGPYNSFDEEKTLKLRDEHMIISKPSAYQESTEMRRIDLNSSSSSLHQIYTVLFELVIDQFLVKLPESIKISIIDRLTNPKSHEDHQLAVDLIDLLYLEWLIPADIPLNLAYVDLIEYDGNTYDFAKLREIINSGSETEILLAIDHFVNLSLFPFACEQILAVAQTRGFAQVITKISALQQPPKDSIVYYPHVVYQIEAMTQLILEDFSDRVYVHLKNQVITFHSTLIPNSNRNGAHHAEMPKLYTALGLANYDGQSALEIVLDNTVNVRFGPQEQFKSLEEIRDALLTYELTTLLVSQQNWNYYLENDGKFHEKTGKGATNGTVGLLKYRLFFDNEPYTITATYSDQSTLQIHSSQLKALAMIAEGVGTILDIAHDQIKIENNQVVISIKPTDLIAKLRRCAICYEGLNVITDEGQLLLAYRKHKGLASAGGHHGNKYGRYDIAYGLYSEFGLVFKNPKAIATSVTLLLVEQSSKTGIYVIPASALTPSSSKHAASNLPIAFCADPDEFDVGSEAALSLVEMRGKRIYDVMPLEELARHYLQQLGKELAAKFPEIKNKMQLEINTSYDIEIEKARYKVPSKEFGKISLIISPGTQLSAAFQSHEISSKQEVYLDYPFNFEQITDIFNSLIIKDDELSTHPNQKVF